MRGQHADPFTTTFGNGRGGAGRDGGAAQVPATITVANPLDALRGAGKSFTFEVVRKGERYGYKRRQVHDKDGPIIQVYDRDYAGKDSFDERGQFVCSYYLSALIDHVGESDLVLHRAEPEWRVHVQAMSQVREWLHKL